MTPVRFRNITPTGSMCITASYGNRKIVQQRQFQSRRLRQAGSANRGVSFGQGLIRVHIGSGFLDRHPKLCLL